MVAAVPLHYQLTLITDHAKDFSMPDLSLHILPEYLKNPGSIIYPNVPTPATVRLAFS